MVNYNGKFKIFDPQQIKAYPISTRTNKVKLNDLLQPQDVSIRQYNVTDETATNVKVLTNTIVALRNNQKPVILFTGGHLIKNGFGLLLADLVDRGLVTLVAGNGSTSIHDFELALIGETSEYVPQALEQGQFGMAYEFCYHNYAIQMGDHVGLGYGESLGRMICDDVFREKILKQVVKEGTPERFSYPQNSVLAMCYKKNIPFTVHVGIGTDVIDQHPSFGGRAKGGCSGRDFLIYAEEVSKLTQGGAVINIGSAVTGPEVFLKAASMAGNIGKVPNGIITADFDIRHYAPDKMSDESSQYYYFRDQKSVVTRVPQAFNGTGYYIQGNQINTFPYFYKTLIQKASQ